MDMKGNCLQHAEKARKKQYKEMRCFDSPMYLVMRQHFRTVGNVQILFVLHQSLPGDIAINI